MNQIVEVEREKKRTKNEKKNEKEAVVRFAN